MTEIAVPQRSPEWFALRESVLLTASRFGDAIGVGVGKPFDFLQSQIYISPGRISDQNNELLRHGTAQEPIMDEAYQLLTGHRTMSSGFWIPPYSDPLHQMVGASPDAKVLDASGGCVGLAEFKAPAYCMYSERTHGPHGIPRSYLAQMQGQMAVCSKPWCDFMAVCTKTKEIRLKRVYFQPSYWLAVSAVLQDFCLILKEARRRHDKGMNPFNFPAAQELRGKGPAQALLAGEQMIPVEDLLQINDKGEFRALSAQNWMSYDFLMGAPCKLEPSLKQYGSKLLQEVDAIVSRETPGIILR